MKNAGKQIQNRNDFLVIIPAYNEEENIESTLRRVLAVVKEPGKIVVVDDCSTDGTVQIVKKFDLVLLKHSQNKGKGAAIKTGFDFAIRCKKPFVFTLDADAQHDPAFIPVFLKKGGEEQDIVIGTRKIRTHLMPLDRYASNQITSLVISLLGGARIKDSQCGYRFIKLDLLKKIHLKTDHFEMESELLLKYLLCGARISQVPVSTIYSGESSSIRRGLDTFRFILMIGKTILHGC